MQANISNVMDGLINIINNNMDTIEETIDVYENGRTLTIFKGNRSTIPSSKFPSLELEPSSGSMQWNSTDTQIVEYSVDFTLTISTQEIDISAEYIGALSRELVEIFNMPYNMHFIIPNEKGFNPTVQDYCPLTVQFGSVSSIAYNANREGTLRLAQWTWTGGVRESYPREYWDYKRLKDLGFIPRQIPE